MYAIRQHEFGAAENLRYEQVADPEPGTGQVRITVAAAGVHLIDTAIRSGVHTGPFPLPELPMTPGREVAGVVDRLGTDAPPGWLGTRVVAHLGQASGGYAELAVADAGSLHEIPAGVSDEAAIAMIGTGRTTLAVLDVADLTPHDVVLITSAAGGVGNLLVQEARNLGATSVGLAGGPEKVDKVRALGATIAVDYTQETWPAAVRDALGERPVTVALEAVGGVIGRQVFELLGPGGRMVMFGWAGDNEPTAVDTGDLYARAVTVSVAVGARITQRPGGLRGLETDALAAAASGRFAPLPGSTFPLADAAKAHAELENRRTIGKVVLKA